MIGSSISAVGGRWLAPTAIIAAFLVVWEAAVRLTATPIWLLPPPSAVALTLVRERDLLLANARVTLVEVLVGFALALVAGVALAIALDASPALHRALYPLVIGSQTIPIPAIAPLLLIWFGYGLLPKVLVTALVGFFPIVVNMADGLRAADRETDQLLRSLGASRWTRFRLLRFPSALPALFSGAKIAVAICVIGAVFGELVGAKAGLGYLLTRAIAQFQTERVIAAIVLLSLIATLLFAAIALLERLAMPWRRFQTAAAQ
ncbi:MAG TPA: ABC transporter permease [Thermomicrobiales bacterium]|nr:ABC transporter permease [Thermomicrobiales bacterium]